MSTIQNCNPEIGGFVEIGFHNDEPIASTSRDISTSEETQWCEAILKLCTIFSDINPDIIKNIYSRQAKDTNLKNEDLLNSVSEELINNQKDCTRLKNFLTNVEDLKVFTEIVPEDTNANEELQSNSFDVEKFLIAIPNAVEFFENPERTFEYSLKMFELFKNYFRQLKLSTISDEYTRKGFNPIETFETLKNKKIEINVKRKKTKIDVENCQNVLIEFEYISNREAIINYIILQEDNEKYDPQKLDVNIQQNQEQLECECCFEGINPKFAISCGEGHVFCKTCTITGTDVELQKGCYRIKCFQECNSELNLNTLQKILMPNKFKILLAKVQEQEIAAAKIEGLASCPFCHYAIILPENDKVLMCMNLDCGKISCRLCKKLDHLPRECEKIERNKKARLILEEKMTAALVRTCARCGKESIKDGGCNFITCPCGQTYCYYCGKSSISHDHVNGICSASTSDASTVAFVGRKVTDALLQIDPNLQINVESILPTNYTNVSSTSVPAIALKESSTLPEF